MRALSLRRRAFSFGWLFGSSAFDLDAFRFAFFFAFLRFTPFTYFLLLCLYSCHLQTEEHTDVTPKALVLHFSSHIREMTAFWINLILLDCKHSPPSALGIRLTRSSLNNEWIFSQCVEEHTLLFTLLFVDRLPNRWMMLKSSLFLASIYRTQTRQKPSAVCVAYINNIRLQVLNSSDWTVRMHWNGIGLASDCACWKWNSNREL